MFLKSRLSPSVLLFIIVSTLLLACSKDKDPIEEQLVLSDENSILSLDINTPYFSTNAQIDEENKLITQRIPEFINLSNLSTVFRVSDRATISPNPNDVKDYSNSVKFTVTSESGIKKDYTVTMSKMSNFFSESCKTGNATKWFGGDDRTNAPQTIPYDRNVGTGQAILFNKDTNPLIFNVFLSDGFQYYSNGTYFYSNLELKLNIRDISGKIIGTTTKTILGTSLFNGGSISFDLTELKLFFKKDVVYIFQWYLVDGEILGVNTGSTGNINSGEGFCFSGGFTSQSNISKQSNQEDMKIWRKNAPWNFNIEIMGKD